MKRFLDWLLYDIPLFKNKKKVQFDRSIPKEKWKKNWLGLTKVYESYSDRYTWCFIRISSHLSEDDYIEDHRNTLTIGFGGSYIKWLLPFSIIKPVLDYHHYQNDEKGNPLIKWTVYEEREYEIRYTKDEGYICINWNHADNLLYNINKHKSKSFWLWLFWKQCTRSKKELLNLDKTFFKDITDLNYDDTKVFEDQQEAVYFDILDYDKEFVMVKARIERSTYSYGNSKFTKFIMKFFKKPNVYTYLDLEFQKEVGSKKGSWKGGTTGHSVEMLDNEDFVATFKRYCIDPNIRGSRSSMNTNMTFLGYKYEKEYGITDSITKEVYEPQPIKYAIVDYDHTFISEGLHGYKEDYDIALKFEISDTYNEDITLYKIKNEANINVYLFGLYLHKRENQELEVKSNCLNYLFTEYGKTCLLSQDSWMVKHLVFEDIKDLKVE